MAAHESLVTATLDRLSRVPGLRSQLWIAGKLDHPVVSEWARVWGLPVLQQRGSDLGARMLDALNRCLATGPYGIVVGTDCPAVTGAYVVEAARHLMDCPLVIGPAEDGGYGLIGLSRPAPELFTGIPWGSDAVLEETLERARAANIRYRLLDTVWDVDEPSDWARYLEKL